MSLDPLQKLEIQELLNRYSHNADFEPPERMRELFSEDAVFEVPAMGLRFAGIDAIIAFFHSARATKPDVRHVISNAVIEGAGDSATSSAYLQIIDQNEGLWRLAGLGRYQDKILRGKDGKWRFTHRHIVLG